MNTDEKLMKGFYYNPSFGATPMKKLYDKVKDKGITQKIVKEFIDKQEAHQLFKTKKKKINYIPIYASYKNENLEGDVQVCLPHSAGQHGEQRQRSGPGWHLPALPGGGDYLWRTRDQRAALLPAHPPGQRDVV